MDREKRLELLLKARNILHKQENNQKITGNEIVFAHDYVDMVIDDMVQEQSLKLYHVAVSYGSCTIAAKNEFEVIGFIIQEERLLRDNTDLYGNILPTKEILSFIKELPYTVQGRPGIVSFYQE
jgi:hypothetical protein